MHSCDHGDKRTVYRACCEVASLSDVNFVCIHNISLCHVHYNDTTEDVSIKVTKLTNARSDPKNYSQINVNAIVDHD